MVAGTRMKARLSTDSHQGPYQSLAGGISGEAFPLHPILPRRTQGRKRMEDMKTAEKNRGVKVTDRTPLEAAGEEFEESTDLAKALDIVSKNSILFDQYHHYTNYARVIQLLLSKRWWLTRGDMAWLNDRAEHRKYGLEKTWKRLFQASFARGKSEHAFMWALYCRHDANAVRITIPKEAMFKWREEVKCLKTVQRETPGRQHCSDKHPSDLAVELADMRDVVYAATSSPRTKRTGERQNAVSWNDAVASVPGLETEILKDDAAGWIKDYEWRAEQETRICVRLKSAKGDPKCVSIPIPVDVLTTMSFTFGPWTGTTQSKDWEAAIRSIYAQMGLAPKEKAFKPSMLTGALEQWMQSPME